MTNSIEDRLVAYARSGDPHTLWPQVSRQACDIAQRALAGLTADILSDSPAVPQVRAASDEELAALGVMGFRSGMGPLVGWWVTQSAIEADARATQLFQRHLVQNRRRMEVLEAAMLRAVDALHGAGIPVTLLKGGHTARVYFPGPETRPAADIDLLVEPDRFDRAAVALQSVGFVEMRRTRHPARSEWIDRARAPILQSLEVEDPASPWSIDLHHSLERHYFRGVRAGFPPSLWSTAALAVEGRQLRALAQPLLLAFLALHASHALPAIRLIRLVELVLVIRRDVGNGTLVWHDLGELLEATATERFVYPALELAERLVPGTVSEALRARLSRAATPRMRRVVDQVSAANMQPPPISVEERLMWARGPIEVLSNIGDVLWPSDDAIATGDLVQKYVRRWRMLWGGRVRWRAR